MKKWQSVYIKIILVHAMLVSFAFAQNEWDVKLHAVVTDSCPITSAIVSAGSFPGFLAGTKPIFNLSQSAAPKIKP